MKVKPTKNFKKKKKLLWKMQFLNYIINGFLNQMKNMMNYGVQKGKSFLQIQFSDLFLSDFNYDHFCATPPDVDKKVSPISPLEGDEEEIKEGKGIKI